MRSKRVLERRLLANVLRAPQKPLGFLGRSRLGFFLSDAQPYGPLRSRLQPCRENGRQRRSDRLAEGKDEFAGVAPRLRVVVVVKHRSRCFDSADAEKPPELCRTSIDTRRRRSPDHPGRRAKNAGERERHDWRRLRFVFRHTGIALGQVQSYSLRRPSTSKDVPVRNAPGLRLGFAAAKPGGDATDMPQRKYSLPADFSTLYPLETAKSQRYGG